MARPKKKPRERFQITLTLGSARKLRAYCKRNDMELSSAIEKALVSFYLWDPNDVPQETKELTS